MWRLRVRMYVSVRACVRACVPASVRAYKKIITKQYVYKKNAGNKGVALKENSHDIGSSWHAAPQVSVSVSFVTSNASKVSTRKHHAISASKLLVA